MLSKVVDRSRTYVLMNTNLDLTQSFEELCVLQLQTGQKACQH